MPYLEAVRTRNPLPETFPHHFHESKSPHWLSDYEKRSDSIFHYYSLENEVAFLKKAENLSLSKKTYYVEENVKRFLGEFVGKIPYTTIPYEVDGEGFSYAGLHVMDSYRTAARLGGEREKAETNGFEQIEQEFKKGSGDTSAFWVSPPKIADYGFVFVLEKDNQGFVKEYILRYPEKRGELTKSSRLFSNISAQDSSPLSTDEYLLHPIFGKHVDKKENVEEVMRLIGIDEEKIQFSRQFEQSVDARLGIWIRKYSEIMCSLAAFDPHSFLYQQGLIEAKKILLTIYQNAEEIRDEKPNPSPVFESGVRVQTQLDQKRLYDRVAVLQSNASRLPTAAAGSCPTIPGVNPLENRVISNAEILQSLTQGTPPEQSLQKIKADTLDCTCPYCKQKVKAVIANGTITCPRKECGKSAPYAC